MQIDPEPARGVTRPGHLKLEGARVFSTLNQFLRVSGFLNPKSIPKVSGFLNPELNPTGFGFRVSSTLNEPLSAILQADLGPAGGLQDGR